MENGGWIVENGVRNMEIAVDSGVLSGDCSGYWIGVWNVEIAVDSGVVSEDCSGYWSGEWSLVKSGLESLVERGMEGGVEREEWRLKSGECRVENG